MIMVPIKEALTFDDVTLVPKYSEVFVSKKNPPVRGSLDDVSVSIKRKRN